MLLPIWGARHAAKTPPLESSSRATASRQLAALRLKVDLQPPFVASKMKPPSSGGTEPVTAAPWGAKAFHGGAGAAVLAGSAHAAGQPPAAASKAETAAGGVRGARHAARTLPLEFTSCAMA